MYQEFMNPNMDNPDRNIRYIEEIPPTYRTVFQEYPCFNTVQSSVLDEALQTDNSLVVSAPTGSGKTAIFEMAIVRLLMANENAELHANTKMIYISPIKALCRERLIDWHRKFADYGVKCIALTSDTNDIDVRNISQYNLIISTPEKWDVVTRRWKDNQNLVAAINLFMIDEVHLLNADSRGSTLEVIVSRMKTAEEFLMLKQAKPKIRFVALSATIPNVEDIAEWIEPSGKAKYFKFSEEVRPVKLNKVVIGSDSTNKSPFKLDLFLNYKLPSLIYQYSKGKPTLIFCSTRKSVEMTTNHLVTNLQIRLSQEQKEVLNQISSQVNDAKLKQFIVHGIAIHHAGLVPENRNIIETSFRKGHLPILVTTSTLAMGVNLPAHLVIIKGTKRYDTHEGYKDYDEVSIFQMIGRAGRSQFDTSATAVILTSLQEKKKYLQMLNCTQKIESNLHKHLTEHLNAEIVLKTITDLEVAMNWLSSTFLYVRAKKCPEKYKLPAGLSKDKIDKKLLEICKIDLNKLVRAGMIKMNQGIEVAPTVVGEIMAKYYIDFNTMELFTKISGNEIMIQILALFSKCHEFSEVYLRSNDKKCLNLLNKNTQKESNRFPLTGRIKTVDMKVNCIIQAVLGNLDISDQSVLNDSSRVMRSCERLAKCLIEYLETRTNCYAALLNTTILAKCFQVKLWENSPYVSKQLTGVGQVISTLLCKAGKTSFKAIINTNPRNIEMIVGRKAPFGNNIVDEALHLPEYQMTMQKYNNKVDIVINLLNPIIVENKPTVSLSSKMTLLVGDSDNNILLYEKYAHSYMLDHPKVTRSINIQKQSVEFVTADLISEDWVGIDCHFKLEILPKPTDSTSQPQNMNQNKNKKQTFMDMYMKNVKSGNTIKKVKSFSKKNDSSNVENYTIPIKEQHNTAKSNEKDENLVKNKENRLICQSTSTNMSDIALCNNNEENCADLSRSASFINNNCSEPTDKEFATPQVEPKMNNSAKKTVKTKKILMAKSIFRTKSNVKNSNNLKKRKSLDMNNTEIESQHHTTTTNKIILSQFQKNEIINPRDPNQSLDNDSATESPKFKSRNSDYTDMAAVERNHSYKSQINNYENNKTQEDLNLVASEEPFFYKSQENVYETNTAIVNDNKFKAKHANGISRTISEEPFPFESELNAAMDAFEMKENTEAKNKLRSDNAYFSYDDTNKFKNLNNNYTNLSNKNSNDQSCESNIHIKNINNTVSDQYSQIYNDFGNKKSLGIAKSKNFQRNLTPHKEHTEQRRLENVKDIRNEILSKYPSPTRDIEGVNNNNNNTSKVKSQSFGVSKFPIGNGDKKINLTNRSPCFTNNSKNEKFMKHNKEHNPFENNKNTGFSEAMCDSKVYDALYKKYNSKVQAENLKNQENYERKETQEKNIRVTMDYPDSTGKQTFFQRENFLPEQQKRHRDMDDFPSRFEGSQTKRIKWRSPLVHSPSEIFLPSTKSNTTFYFDFGDEGSSSKEDTKESNDLRIQDASNSSATLDLSINSQKHLNLVSSNASTRKKLVFPLCDQDYVRKDDSLDKHIKYLGQICDLENFGLINKQPSSQKDTHTAKHSSHPTSSAGEYYSQLMSSQRKNISNDTETDERTEHKNRVASYDPAFNTTIIPSQKLQSSSIPDTNFVDPNSSLSCSQFHHYSRPSGNDIYNQRIPYEQKSNPRSYNAHVPKECLSNNHEKHFENNLNYIGDMPLGHQDASLKGVKPNDSVHDGFVNLQNSQRKLPPSYCDNYCLDDERFELQPSPNFGYQRPFSDEMMYRHREMMPPYPIPSRLPPSLHIRYPIPRYAGMNPYVKERYPLFEVAPYYPVEHINNPSQRSYYSQIGTVPGYVDEFTQHAEQLDSGRPYFKNNKNYETSMNQFKRSSLFEEKLPGFLENTNESSNLFRQANRHDQESRGSELSQHNHFRFGQANSRSTILNEQSQLDNPARSSSSEMFSKNNQKVGSLSKNNIGQLFSPTPKQKLQHIPNLNMSQNQKPGLSKTPHPNLIPSSQGRLFHGHSFEERLNNSILSRNQSFMLSPPGKQPYDPRNNFRSASYEPNDKEFVGRFLFHNRN